MPTTISPSGSDSRTAPPWRGGTGWGCLLLLALPLACTDPGKPEPCFNEDQPSVSGPPESAVLRGRLVVEAATSVDEKGNTVVKRSIRATLVDVSSVLQTPRKISTLGIGTPGCYALTGQPIADQCRDGFTPPCSVEKLEVDKVEVIGLPGGDISLVRTDKGIWDKEDLAAPLFGSGPVTIRITGRNDKGFFPSLEVEVPQPSLLEVRAPLVDPGVPLGATDLKIRWAAAGADLIAINANETTGATTDDLQCLVVDDGCHSLLAADLDFLEMKVGVPLKLQLIRENTRVVVDANPARVSLEVKLVSRVEMLLTR